jgi:cobalt/nickel transport system ATP-binding protein
VGLIEARGVAYEYPDGTRAVSGIDLEIGAGERVAVVGANGSGKSTLGLLLGGLLEPSAGELEYFGRTTDPEAVRERVGVLLQDPEDYLFNTTVREDIAYGPAQFGMDRARAEERVETLADELGLSDLLDKPPFRLSGGEKQRAAVASVLSFEPDVLVLDEPLGAVDATYRERILGLLDDHAGASVVLTPALDLVPHVAERVVLVGGGGVVAEGGVREILTDRALLSEWGLRPPATVRLFEGRVPDDELPLTVAAGRELLGE